MKKTHIALLGFVATALVGAATAGAAQHGKANIVSCDPTQFFVDNGGASPTINARGKFTKSTNVIQAEVLAGSSATAKLTTTAGVAIAGCSVTDASGGSSSSVTCGAITGAVFLDLTAS
ncbi:MAG TPA: hypothetical protein VMG12_03280 [Polyangiaceae bacterium]|nr:hypothetical protein [Polyangiaceae bacterium]